MSELNDWFLSLPEARQAVLRDDKWFLAEAAFAAGKAARAQPAQAEAVPKFVWGYVVRNPKEPQVPHKLAYSKVHADAQAVQFYCSEIIPLVAAAPQQAEAASKCAQCQKPYKAGSTVKGCPKCAPGVVVAEAEFQKPIGQQAEAAPPQQAESVPCGSREYCGRFPFCGCGDSDPLPERDKTKPNEQQGLFHKFVVRRTDGSDAPGGKHDGCEYFVLDVTHDKHAKPALAAYAASVETTHPQLAVDMRARYEFAAPPQAEVRTCHVFNVTKNGSLTEWEPTTMAFALPDGKHALYTASQQARADLEAENQRLREALDLALEYWEHRQQRYKNRSPVWVELARAALENKP